MTYLASPYSHPNPAVRRARYEAACRHAASMMRRGELVYSPIAHGHSLATHGLPGDWSYWEAHTRAMMDACDTLAVLCLEGWDTSVGVLAEIPLARAKGLRVRYLEPMEMENAPALAEA